MRMPARRNSAERMRGSLTPDANDRRAKRVGQFICIVPQASWLDILQIFSVPRCLGGSNLARAPIQQKDTTILVVENAMTRRAVQLLTDGESIDEVYLISDKQLRTNRQGNYFLQLELRDRT